MKGNPVRKLSILGLFAFIFTTGHGFSEQKDRSGFQVSKMLSEQALSHSDGKDYPSGVVTKTINVSGYTYFQFKDHDELTWAATNEMSLPEGTKVVLMKSYPMYDFKSKTLEKTFKKILFVSQLDVIK